MDPPTDLETLVLQSHLILLTEILVISTISYRIVPQTLDLSGTKDQAIN